jgi:murein DD-endopeptidase MepM/ murein hydrolase activator NlpD
MEESKPFLHPQTVLKPEDYGGNYVLIRVSPDVYALYAHLQPGSIGARVDDRVKTGAPIGNLGTLATRAIRTFILGSSIGRTS